MFLPLRFTLFPYTTLFRSRLNIKSELGATAVEYGIMVALIAAVIIAAVVFLGQKTSSTFSCTASAVSAKNSTCLDNSHSSQSYEYFWAEYRVRPEYYLSVG